MNNNYELVINDLALKVANLVVENAFKEAKIQELTNQLTSLNKVNENISMEQINE